MAVVTGTGADRMAVFLRTRRAQLPCYVLWRMMREGLYAFGLEPCNSPFGTTDELLAQGWPLMLEPGERRPTSWSSGSSPATRQSKLTEHITDRIEEKGDTTA